VPACSELLAEAPADEVGADVEEKTMPIGLVGRKCGMTRIFTEQGDSIPVTVVQVLPNRVTLLKNEDRDGYRAVQVTAGKARPGKLGKADLGHYAKQSAEPGEGLWEFRLHGAEGEGLEPGAELRVEQFEPGQRVDVVGTSKGKGFAGTVKRHNFRMQDATHGNSVSHRAPGSIGQNQSPGRVFKGKKMSGHLGNERVTATNLEVVKVDANRNLLLIKGAVPGAASGRVVVKPSTKVKKSS
jgi:large subunit ribosomal protein L3